MSMRKPSTKHALPANPSWLEFPRSDGDSSIRPPNTERVVDHEGHVNYMRPVEIDESTCIDWRKKIGPAVARALNMPDGPDYVLKSWPANYHMYDHNKGPENNPRHDAYLYGSTNSPKFRSANEFVPHAIWLFTDATQDRSNCECKYCTKQPQSKISQALGLSKTGRVSPSPSALARPPKPREKKPREPRARDPKPFAAVRTAPRIPKKLVGPKQSASSERLTDIKESLRKSDIREPRLFRAGELIWCTIDPAIRGPTGDDDNIVFWPGLVEEAGFKTETTPLDPVISDQNGPLQSSSASDTASQSPRARISWKVYHRNVYKVKLLATPYYVSISDLNALPYLAYAPPVPLVTVIRQHLNRLMETIDIEEMDRSLDRMYDFNPHDFVANSAAAPGDSSRFQQAVAPFTLAIEIASVLARFWTPTDEWDCKYTLLPARYETAPPPTYESSSLSSALAAAASANAKPATTHPISGPPGATEDELKELSAKVLGSSQPGAVARSITQLRYQGLWWGAERIWTDELVRLKLARCQFAPKGATMIFPPAGGSKSTMDSIPNSGDVDPATVGASEKGLFMRLDGIFVVDVPSADGQTVKECRVSGMIYELADADWEERDDLPPSEETPNIVDKGKGRADAASPIGPGRSASQPNTPVRPSAGSNGLGLQTGPPLQPDISPLKPVHLPNSDSPQKERDANSQMAHPPVTSHFTLPPPPNGFKFRPILPPGNEAVVSLSLISGRYYPGLFTHPLLRKAVEHALSLSSEEGGLFESGHLWALEGILPGVYQSMDPQLWKSSRVDMFKDSDAEVRAKLRENWFLVKAQREHGMDADADGETEHEAGDITMEDAFVSQAGPSGLQSISAAAA